VTQIVLRAALAARDAALNREELAASEKTVVAQSPSNGLRNKKLGSETKFVSRENLTRPDKPNPGSYDPNRNVVRREEGEGAAPYVVELPAAPRRSPAAIAPRAVPDVRGLALREAVRALHQAGFRVRLLGPSPAGTSPAAGTIAPPGTIVQLSRPLE